MSGVASSSLPSQWNPLNENYVKTVLLSLRGSVQKAVLKWGFCDLGIFDLDRIHLRKGHKDALFSSSAGGEEAFCVHDGSGGVPFSFFSGSCLRVCIFVSLPNPSEVYVFFSRYLQERLKQLHEEVNLLKSNIAKYKVENPDDAGSDSP